jgi:hypothetical protein
MHSAPCHLLTSFLSSFLLAVFPSFKLYKIQFLYIFLNYDNCCEPGRTIVWQYPQIRSACFIPRVTFAFQVSVRSDIIPCLCFINNLQNRINSNKSCLSPWNISSFLLTNLYFTAHVGAMETTLIHFLLGNSESQTAFLKFTFVSSGTLICKSGQINSVVPTFMNTYLSDSFICNPQSQRLCLLLWIILVWIKYKNSFILTYIFYAQYTKCFFIRRQHAVDLKVDGGKNMEVKL